MTTPRAAASGRAGGVRPANRYGDRRRSPRRVATLAALAVVVAVAALAWVWFGYFSPRDSVSGQLLSYEHVSPTAVEARVAVTREPGEAAVCVLRTLDYTGTEVGRVTVSLPAGPETSLVRDVRIDSLAPVRTAELVTCRAAT